MTEAETKTEVFTVTEMGEPAAEKQRSSTNKKSFIFERYVQPCMAELLGTTLFVFVGCGSVIGNVAGVTAPAVAHGLMLGVMIAVFGQISGGHFNPVVSLSAYLCGGMTLCLLLPYIVAQMVGAMAGAGLAKAVFPSLAYDGSYGAAFVIDATNLAAATLTEVILTLILTMVVCLGAINSQTRSPLAPFCIGLTVTANIFAGGYISGACMNPARAFGPALVANHWTHHWVFWVGPVCGALFTVILVRFFFGDKKMRIMLK